MGPEIMRAAFDAKAEWMELGKVRRHESGVRVRRHGFLSAILALMTAFFG